MSKRSKWRTGKFYSAVAEQLRSKGFYTDEHELSPNGTQLSDNLELTNRQLRSIDDNIGDVRFSKTRSEFGLVYFLYDTDRISESEAASGALKEIKDIYIDLNE